MQRLLRRLSTKPVVGRLASGAIKMMASHEVKQIAKHFSQYFSPRLADTDALKHESFAIRHNVYCEELQFEPFNELGEEIDEFDQQSLHCLLEHTPYNRFAGTIRVVRSPGDDQPLPMEKYCLNSITDTHLHPHNFPRREICEISRLAVPSSYRRRNTDKYKGAAVGVINEQVYSERELRCFPFIAVGLYLSAASIVVNKGINHCFVMMEPRLARSMKFVGINFHQIGPVVDYHGKRAPYYLDPHQMLQNLNEGFGLLFMEIDAKLGGHYHKADQDPKTHPGIPQPQAP